MSTPNIVFILIDDLGWRDLGCYGSTFYETQNLDRLAAQGVRFTQATAACPVCSPSRASLMTGKWPARLGITQYIHDSPGSRGKLVDAPFVRELAHTEVSVANALREGGYTTWHVGKWHLGKESFYPETHGFEVNIGGCYMGHPHHGYFSPYQIPTLTDGPEGEYLTDRLTDEAMALVERHVQSGSDKPFFLNFWHYAVHTPIQVPEALKGKYLAKAAALGLDKIPPFEEGEPFPTEEKQHLRVRRRRLQSDPAYAAMVENLDTNIGRLVARLPENTVVIFTSDNGGLATSEGSPTCNAPLVEGKGWMYEGGIREPLIVWEPRRFAPQLCETPLSSPDFYPTLLELAGLTPRPEQHCDGRSFVPLLHGETLPERPLFWHYPHYGNQGGTPGAAVRLGPWKLIEFFEDNHCELYNLDDDPSEQENVALQNTARVAQLQDLLHRWQEEVAAVHPLANPKYVKETTC